MMMMLMMMMMMMMMMMRRRRRILMFRICVSHFTFEYDQMRITLKIQCKNQMLKILML